MERRPFLLARRLLVSQTKGHEIFARCAPQQPNAFDHVPGYDGLGVSSFGEEDVEGVGV